MSLFSFIHEDLRIVRAISKLQELIAGALARPIVPYSDIVGYDNVIIHANPGSYQVMLGMSLTPPAGTYLVEFSGDISIPGGINEAKIIISRGLYIQESERTISCGDVGVDPYVSCFYTQAKVTVDGTETIDGDWYISAGTATNLHRQMSIIRVQ